MTTRNKMDVDEKKEVDEKSDSGGGKSDDGEGGEVPKGMTEIKITPFSTTCVLGKRNTGKSFLSKWLIQKMVNQGIYNTVYLFSTTERYSHSFNCLEKNYIIDCFDISFIKNVLDAQKKQIDKYGLKSDKVAKILFVFDDLVGSISTGSKEMQMLNFLFATSRHLAIGLLICAQCSRSLISPCMRQNVDYLLLRSLNDDYVKSLYESVYWTNPGGCKSFLAFTKKAFKNTTFEFLCYNNTVLEDSEKWSLVLAEETDFMLNMEKPKRKKGDGEGKKKDDKEKNKNKLKSKK